VHHVATDASALPEQKILAGMQSNCGIQDACHVAPLIVEPALCFQRECSKSSGGHEEKCGTTAIPETKRDEQGADITGAKPAPVAEISAHGCDAAGGQGITSLSKYGIRPRFMENVNLLPGVARETRER
jgi:hypothetical protein